MTRQGRRKAAIYASVIAVGLMAGFAIRANVDRLFAIRADVDRPLARQQLNLTYGDPVTVMVQLFEAFCIGDLRGKPLDPNISLFPGNPQDNPIWIEPSTELQVELDLDTPQTCSVTDYLRPLSPSEKTRLATIVSDSIPSWAPELSPRASEAKDLFFLKAWTTHDDHPEPHWGIILAQAEETGPNAFTVLSLGLPYE